MKRYGLQINDKIRYVGNMQYCQARLFNILVTATAQGHTLVDLTQESMLLRLKGTEELVSYDIYEVMRGDDLSQAVQQFGGLIDE